MIKRNKDYNNCILVIKGSLETRSRKDLTSEVNENQECANEISFLESEKNSLSLKFQNEEDEEANWNKIALINSRIEELKEKISENEKLINLSYSERLSDVVNRLISNVLISLYNKNKVVLNKLPRYNVKPELPSGISLRAFWETNQKNILDEYLKYSYSISMLFKNADSAIVYNNESLLSDNYAIVDYSKILALHPKMMLFDFNRFGFFRNNNSISNLAFNNLDKMDLNVSETLKKELKNATKALFDCRINRLKKLSELSNEDSIDKEKKIKQLECDFEIAEKDLMIKQYIILLKQSNSDITEPSETKKILENIEEEINIIINDISSSYNLKKVLNSSYPDRINNYGKLTIGSDVNIFLQDSFQKFRHNLFDRELKKDSLRRKSYFIDLINLLEILLHKRTIFYLGIKNKSWLANTKNAKRIDNEIIEELYNRYNLSSYIILDAIKE